MLVANAVVDTDQPRLQVGENQMDDRQVLLGNLWITTLGNSEVWTCFAKVESTY